MSVWNLEVVKIDGEHYAAIKVQDDWTGNITMNFRKVRYREGKYYIKVDGRMENITEIVQRNNRYEDSVKEALEWTKQTKWRG